MTARDSQGPTMSNDPSGPTSTQPRTFTPGDGTKPARNPVRELAQRQLEVFQLPQEQRRLAERASWKTYRGTIQVVIRAANKRAARAALDSIGPGIAERSDVTLHRDGPELTEGGDD